MTKILVAEGEVVPVGTVLVVIGGDGAEPAAAPDRSRAADRARARSRSSSKCLINHKLAFRRRRSCGGSPQELGVDLASSERHRAERADHRGRRPQRGRRGACV